MGIHMQKLQILKVSESGQGTLSEIHLPEELARQLEIHGEIPPVVREPETRTPIRWSFLLKMEGIIILTVIGGNLVSTALSVEGSSTAWVFATFGTTFVVLAQILFTGWFKESLWKSS